MRESEMLKIVAATDSLKSILLHRDEVDKYEKRSHKKFYEQHSWGSIVIEDAKDLPTLKMRYLMEVLKQRKRKNAKLLELGSGSGRILTSIRARDRHLQLFGVDISSEQVKIARKVNKGKNITFIHGDAEKPPFPNSTFDFVIIMDFLEHVPHPQQALDEAFRILKPGGILYAGVPAERHGIYLLSMKLFGRHFKEETGGHLQQYTKRQIESMVRKAKFTIADEKYSYHLLGSIMDYTLFTLLLNKSLAKVFWSKGKYYQGTKKKQTVASRILNALMTFGNAIAYYESTIFKRTSFLATAVHITARKGGKK